MKNNDIKTWFGDVPQACDICGLEITNEFIDGRTGFRGMWACMCPDCHKQHGDGRGEVAYPLTNPVVFEA